MLLSITSFLGENGDTWAASWLPLSILAVIVTVIFHGMLLMFGRAFNIKEIETFAIGEIMNAAATAFLAIFLVTIVLGAMSMAESFIHGTLTCGGQSMNIGTNIAITTANPTVMDDAFNAIRCTLQYRAETVSSIQQNLIGSGTSWAEFNALNIGASIFGVTFFKGEWIGSLYQDTETKRITNNLATVMLIALNAQGALLVYLQANMLAIFLPVGILLRSFYFTRGPGALFIALGIGMYFLFPVFYLLLDPGFKPAPPEPPQTNTGSQQYCYATMSTAVSMVSTLQSASVGSGSNLDFSEIRDELSTSYVDMIVHPLVALFLTLVIVRYMMSVLGGDTYELTKMVSKVI